MPKKILLLGSTGSIGRSTLDIISHEKGNFEVLGLACKGNTKLLNAQISAFKPRYVCIYDETQKDSVAFDRSRTFTGMEGLKHLISLNADLVVNALPGSIGLEPTIDTLQSGKTLALANKESIVMAGRIIMRLARASEVKLIPVDSEHSALYQLLSTVPREEVKTVTITASGGPFRNHSKERLKTVNADEALHHPTWKMGPKITLDSATLMNKGLEVIEARWLFDLEPEKIKVIIHPESIIHGIIELTDNSLMAYMALPDMKIPIAYALNASKRLPLPVSSLSFDNISSLSFYPPDVDRFPSLQLAYDALSIGDSALIVLNTANEIASEAFISGRLAFTSIPDIISDALEHHPQQSVVENLADIWGIYQWTKEYTQNKLGYLKR